MSTDSDIQAIVDDLMAPRQGAAIRLTSAPGVSVTLAWVNHKNHAEAVVRPPKGDRRIIAGWQRASFTRVTQEEAMGEGEYAVYFAQKLVEALAKRYPA